MKNKYLSLGKMLGLKKNLGKKKRIGFKINVFEKNLCPKKINVEKILETKNWIQEIFEAQTTLGPKKLEEIKRQANFFL